MQKIFDTRMTKTYGNGFDAVTSKADIRAFIDWWNEKSFFPVEPETTETSKDPNYPMAA